MNFVEKLIEILSYNPQAPLLFNSGFFLYFFLFVLIFNKLFTNYKRAKIIFLTISSIYFYYKSSGIFFILVIISSLIDYIAGIVIHNTNLKFKRKLFLILSLIANLGILGYFKYTNFFINNVNALFSSNIPLQDIFLPVGVSFFTFQSMSYTIDIYRNKLTPERNFTDFLFFVSFFPQLVAGPIVRAADFLPQIHNRPLITKADIGKALFLIIAGLLKKAVIADYISINFVDRVFDWPARYTGVENLLALYGYCLQIYCDFSGYSDMAIGLALLLGFKLPMNFNSPYKAVTITEFWRRWHLSLSSWLRDYLYISLGGNRLGKVRTYINLMLTMLLGGLWHGASWNFVVWGGIHGTALAFERITNLPEKLEKSKILKLFGAIVTFHIWAISMIFFRAQSTQHGIDMVNQIFYYFKPEVFLQFINGYSIVFALMVIGFLSHFTPKKLEDFVTEKISNASLISQAIIITIVIWIVVQFKALDVHPFIYFQF
ncbi:MAG: MBOAT family protein [Ignavibacterium sp.]|nr:MBOAT family protein [Ignavibacterium sp.]MDW8374368.1 MBOAT family O-acyltransferase [Ignavibacteriales bacterium]